MFAKNKSENMGNYTIEVTTGKSHRSSLLKGGMQ